MTSINLYKSSETQEKEQTSFFDSSFYVALALIVLVGGGLLGLKFYAGSLQSSNNALQTQISSAQIKNLKGGDVEKVLDFQGRLDLIKAENNSKTKSSAALDMVANALVAGVFVDSYLYNSKENRMELTLKANDYRAVAAQLFSLKKFSNTDPSVPYKNFGKVELTEIKGMEKGVSFKVLLNLTK